jgi:DNA-binding transcriptional regulator YdaS (Cro superfamily)
MHTNKLEMTMWLMRYQVIQMRKVQSIEVAINGDISCARLEKNVEIKFIMCVEKDQNKKLG